jgi:transcriptional regulator with XRE-family HTH domain
MGTITPGRLLRARKKLGIRMATLGPLCGMNPSTISRIETGGLRVGQPTMTRIEQALADIARVKERFRGLPIDVRDTAWLRREIRKMKIAANKTPPALLREVFRKGRAGTRPKRMKRHEQRTSSSERRQSSAETPIRSSAPDSNNRGRV